MSNFKNYLKKIILLIVILTAICGCRYQQQVTHQFLREEREGNKYYVEWKVPLEWSEVYSHDLERFGSKTLAELFESECNNDFSRLYVKEGKRVLLALHGFWTISPRLNTKQKIVNRFITKSIEFFDSFYFNKTGYSDPPHIAINEFKDQLDCNLFFHTLYFRSPNIYHLMYMKSFRYKEFMCSLIISLTSYERRDLDQNLSILHRCIKSLEFSREDINVNETEDDNIQTTYENTQSKARLKGNAERFALRNYNIVWDRKTGLEWVAGPDRDMSWDEAKSWAENLSIDGGGWRLPLITEARTLYQKGVGMRNMTTLLNTTGWYIWTARTKREKWAYRYTCHGGSYYYGREFSKDARVFAVRLPIED